MFLWETEFWWFASLHPHRASVWKGDINPCVKARHSTVTAEVDSKANPDSGQCGYLTCYGKDDGWLSLSVRVITVITYITVKKCRKPVERILGNIVGQKNLRKKWTICLGLVPGFGGSLRKDLGGRWLNCPSALVFRFDIIELSLIIDIAPVFKQLQHAPSFRALSGC